MHWFDDEVFEQCPTWDECIRAGKIPRPDLERYFGPAPEDQKDPPGKANYAQCVKYGIGRRVLAKALEGTEIEDAIRVAMKSPPATIEWKPRNALA